jgi:hypothetical protein
MYENRDYKGEKNPNFKNAGWKKCVCCNVDFHNYSKTRKYCSLKCYVKHQKDRIASQAKEASLLPRKPKQKLGYKLICNFCKIDFRNLTKRKYCNEHRDEAKKAQSKSYKRISISGKKEILNCLYCKKEFEHYKSNPKIYCSYQCHLDNGGAQKAGLASLEKTLIYGRRKDANHNDVVDALTKAGAYVLDMSHVGSGFPDLIIGYKKETLLVEIKNPKTSYGRKGLNKNQLKWRESWTGGAYCVVDSPEAALRMIGVIK